MPILLNEDIDDFIKYAQEQLENERVLYEGRITDAVEKMHGEKQWYVYSEQWLLLNLPSILDNKSAMKRHHEEIMEEKFQYYNRTNNYDGLCIWVDTLLRNVGFTNQQADKLLDCASRIGEKLYKKNNSSEE